MAIHVILMSDEQETKPEEIEPEQPVRKRWSLRRKSIFGLGLVAVLGVVLSLVSLVAYKYGVFDNYVKEQFTAKMAEIGVVFDADVFRVTINPLELHLNNATFNDRLSGQKLFFIREAHLELTVSDLYAWQLSRDISID